MSGGNITKYINVWAVSLLRYSTAFIDRNCAELTQVDHKTRKLMTIYNALYSKYNVGHLNKPMKEGGKELQGVKEVVKLISLGLEKNVKESRKTLLIAARSVDFDLIEPIRGTTIEAKKQKNKERANFWGEKECCMAILCNKLRK